MQSSDPEVQNLKQQIAGLNSHTHNDSDSSRIDFTSIKRFPTTPSQGDVLYYNGKVWVNLPAGTSGYFLQTQGVGANPVWAQQANIAEPITRDATSTGSLGGALTVTISHTCSGNHRILIVGIEGNVVSTDLVTSVTYNGLSMARLAAIIGNGTESLWFYYMLNPPSGTHNIVVTCSSDPAAGGGGLSINNASYDGVYQIGFPDSSNTGSASPGTSLTVSTTVVATSSWLVAVAGSALAITSNAANTNINVQQTFCLLTDSFGTVGTGSQSQSVKTTAGGSNKINMIVASVEHYQ